MSEVRQQTQKHFNGRRHGERWSTTTPGTLLLPREWENVLFPPQSNGQWNNELPPLQANDEGLRERRDTSAPPRYGKGSTGAHNDTGPVHATSETGTYSYDGQSQDNRVNSGEDKRLTTRPATANNSPGVSRFSEATATANPRAVKPTVDISAQTDNTDNFVVSKDTLVAYTIAVIQQTLDYHFGQMSIVYQSAHNKATLDTLSRAEELAKDHFNIVLLTDHLPGEPTLA